MNADSRYGTDATDGVPSGFYLRPADAEVISGEDVETQVQPRGMVLRSGRTVQFVER